MSKSALESRLEQLSATHALEREELDYTFYNIARFAPDHDIVSLKYSLEEKVKKLATQHVMEYKTVLAGYLEYN